MDRRMFLNGLFGVAGAAAIGGLMLKSAAAMPIAPLDVRTLDTAPDDGPVGAHAPAGRTPDGTEIENAQYYYRDRRWRRRRWRRRWRRRHSRVVCRTYRTRYGRFVRRCRRVYFW